MDQKEYTLHSDVIDRCLNGERDAFQDLYGLYSKAMFNTALRLVSDRDDAEDVLQDAFISAFSHLASFNGTASFGSWLKRIVINKSINFLKKKRPDPLEEEQDFVEEERELYDEEYFPMTVEEVKRGMMRLPEGYRMVLSLYLLEGYDHQEISEILDISVGTSKSQFNRAKRKLREILNVAHHE